MRKWRILKSQDDSPGAAPARNLTIAFFILTGRASGEVQLIDRVRRSVFFRSVY